MKIAVNTVKVKCVADKVLIYLAQVSILWFTAKCMYPRPIRSTLKKLPFILPAFIVTVVSVKHYIR